MVENVNAESCAKPMSDLFNSKTEPIPQIRPDLDVIPVQNNGDSYLYFHDIRGYTTDDFALDYGARNLLALLDGRKSINDLKPYLGKEVNDDQLLEYIRFLDKNRVLFSSHYQTYAEQFEREYEQADVHHSVTAGNSYPADPKELRSYLDDAFTTYGGNEKYSSDQPIKAMYAPHIDPRVGMQTYVESFQALKNLKPKRVVLLATSHYSSLHNNLYKNKPFIVSSKDFAMPLGTVRADREAISRLMQNAKSAGLTNQDRAHRIEHSIELHILFLQYIWNHEYSIVPIVVGGFDELFYMNESHLSFQLDTFARQLREQFGNEEETFFLISGDLAHVGKKFGDDQPAATMRKEVEQFDEHFFEAAESGSTEQMLSLMKRNYDPYRICGFPPLYIFLKAFPDLKGQAISYDCWDETERESAVTFGSIIYP